MRPSVAAYDVALRAEGDAGFVDWKDDPLGAAGEPGSNCPVSFVGYS